MYEVILRNKTHINQFKRLMLVGLSC